MQVGNYNAEVHTGKHGVLDHDKNDHVAALLPVLLELCLLVTFGDPLDAHHAVLWLCVLHLALRNAWLKAKIKSNITTSNNL